MRGLIFICLLWAAPAVAYHDDIKKVPVSCGQIRTYIAALGLQNVINSARQHGATEVEITNAMRKCGIKI
jgi:hypothetical protein